MSNILFIGDTHFGHTNQVKWRTEFESEEEITQAILNNMRKVITKRDVTYFMGDIILSENRLNILEDIPGKKVLVLGNHCTERVCLRKLLTVFDEAHSLIKYKEFWLSHAPLHPEELRGKINIHGHVHSNTLEDNRYINVSCEAINYTPISLDQIRKRIYGRDKN